MAINTERFGGRLEATRTLRGYSQVRLAQTVLCEPKWISNWENGTSPYNDKEEVLRKIAHVLEVLFDWLVGKRVYPEAESNETQAKQTLHTLPRVDFPKTETKETDRTLGSVVNLITADCCIPLPNSAGASLIFRNDKTPNVVSLIKDCSEVVNLRKDGKLNDNNYKRMLQMVLEDAEKTEA